MFHSFIKLVDPVMNGKPTTKRYKNTSKFTLGRDTSAVSRSRRNEKI